jgi:hypothetical protein
MALQAVMLVLGAGTAALDWRDGVSTGLVALAIGYYGAFLRGADVTPLFNVRTVAAGVFMLGMTACLVGGDVSRIGDSLSMDRGLLLEGVLGTMAMLSATAAMLTGSAVVLAVLVAVVVLLWLIAVVRHLAAPRPAVRPAAWTQPAHDRLDEWVHR